MSANPNFPFSDFQLNLIESYRREVLVPGFYPEAFGYDYSSFYGNLMLDNKMPLPPYYEMETYSDDALFYICDVDETENDIKLIPHHGRYAKDVKPNCLVFNFDFEKVNIIKIRKAFGCSGYKHQFEFIEPVIKKIKEMKGLKNRDYKYYKQLINFMHWSLCYINDFNVIHKDGSKVPFPALRNIVIDQYIAALGRSKLHKAMMDFKSQGLKIISTNSDCVIVDHKAELIPRGMRLYEHYVNLEIQNSMKKKFGQRKCINE